MLLRLRKGDRGKCKRRIFQSDNAYPTCFSGDNGKKKKSRYICVCNNKLRTKKVESCGE